MQSKQTRALVRWTAILFLACVSLLPGYALAGNKRSCVPSFLLNPNWQGADAAYSIPLPDGRDVWIFGDTLFGKNRALGSNGDPVMVRNSIGISTCDKSGAPTLHYVIRRDSSGQAKDFFTAQHANTWYWALDGFFYDKSLWVTLLCVRNLPKTSSMSLGFETCGTDLAKVTGLGRDAQRWKVQYFPWSRTEPKRTPLPVQ